MSRGPVIVLRPEPGNGATMARLAARKLPAIAAPLFAIEPCSWNAPTGAFDALLLTSANAVRHAGPTLASLGMLPAWCVGESTAAAARAAGLAVTRIGDSGVAALIGDGEEHVLWLCGCDRTPLASDQDARVTAIPVYRSVELSIDAGLFARPGIALLHSSRAAARLADLVCDRSLVTIVAISDAVEVAAGSGWAAVAVARSPDDADMVAIAAKLCQKQRRTVRQQP